MERPDGKDPFDPDTYNRPSGNVTTMLELRAFCAEFFDKRIRNETGTNDQDIQAFITLVCHSSNYFARARAVIPELQGPLDVEPSNWNPHVTYFVLATRAMRGPSDKQWDLLPEEPVWTELARAGMENLEQNLARHGIGHMKQTSEASAQDLSVNPIVLMPATPKDKPSDSPLHSAMSSASKPKSFPLPKKLDLSNIPVFTPRNPVISEELVWSPTTGSRKPRPDEISQQSTKAGPTSPMQFGQSVSPNVGSAYNVRNQYLFHGSRDFSDSPTRGHRHSDSIRMTPPPEFKSTQSPLNPATARSPRSYEIPRERGNYSNQMPFPSRVDRMTEMTPLSHDPSKHASSSNFEGTEYPTNYPSRTNAPSQPEGLRFPSSQARGVYGLEPFSAPPSIPGYGQLHQTGQGIHGGPPSPFQEQLAPFQSRPAGGPSSAFQEQLASFQSRPAGRSPHPFPGQQPYAHIPDDWEPDFPTPPQRSRQRRGALPDPPHHQMIPPISQTMPQAQFPRPTARAPPITEVLIVPPPGSMLPLDYWNMLHQREMEIRTRLGHAGRPMTDQEQEYVSLLAEARMNAAATQMPARNNMSKKEWLEELHRELMGIWTAGPAGSPAYSAVVTARKQDFAKAVRREMEWTAME